MIFDISIEHKQVHILLGWVKQETVESKECQYDIIKACLQFYVQCLLLYNNSRFRKIVRVQDIDICRTH